MKSSLSYAVICRIIANICSVVTAVIGISLYNHYVSKEVYGTILVGLQIISYVPLVSSGFRMVLNQQTLVQPSAVAAKSIARFSQTLQSYFFLLVVLMGILVMAIYSQIPETRSVHIPIMVYLATGVAAAMTFQAGNQLALLVALGEQVPSSLLQGMWGLLITLILWISFNLGSGVWAFPLSNGFSAALVIVATQIVLVRTKNDIPLFVWRREHDFRERLREVWRPALNGLLSQVGMVLMFSLDLILVGVLIGPGAAAVYGIISRIMAISRQVLQSLSEAAWPRLTQEADNIRKAQMMRKVDRLNAWIVGAWYGAMALTLRPFLTSLVKPDWVASQSLITLIVVRYALVSLFSPHSYGMMSLGRFRDLARLNRFEVVIDAVVGILLSRLVGLNGIAVAFLLGTCSMTAWQLTREYFRFADHTNWLIEWRAVSLRAITIGALSLGLAWATWWLEKYLLAAPGWMAAFAGLVGFGLPASVILGRLLLTRRSG